MILLGFDRYLLSFFGRSYLVDLFLSCMAGICALTSLDGLAILDYLR